MGRKIDSVGSNLGTKRWIETLKVWIETGVEIVDKNLEVWVESVNVVFTGIL